MITQQTTLPNGATIVVWEITETIDELLSIINFNPFTIEQIYNFTSVKRKLEYLAVRAILYTTHSKTANIEYNPDGSPYLSDNSAQISITHTGKYAAVMLHPSQKIGIDIERQSDKVVRVKHKFLSPSEIENIDPRSEKTHLTIHWAAKEALYKIIGIRNIDIINQIQISPFSAYINGEIEAHETNTPNRQTYHIEYDVHHEYVIAWAIAK